MVSAAIQWEMHFCRALNTSDVLSETEKASTPRGDHESSGPRSIYKLHLNEVLMVILWSLKLIMGIVEEILDPQTSQCGRDVP